jgi:4-hydroxybenzoate polyprenyltransferase
MKKSSFSINICYLMPYLQLARLSKPWGIVLLAWPTVSALALSSSNLAASPWLVFLLGIVTTRSAGCVINDYADQWLDHRVERTKERPLVNGDVSAKQALAFFSILIVLSALLLLFLPLQVTYAAIIALLMLVSYPYMKRLINAPQLFLGMVFSQGIPMAYLANNHSFDTIMLGFYGITVLWVITYDTIYALSDYEYDVKMQAGSLAVTLGDYAPAAIQISYIAIFLLWGVWGCFAHMSAIYYISLVACGLNLRQQVRFVKHKQYFSAFLLNQSAGLYLCLGIVVSCLQAQTSVV